MPDVHGVFPGIRQYYNHIPILQVKPGACPVPLRPHCLSQSWMSQGFVASLKHSGFFKADPPTGFAFTWGISQDMKRPELRLEDSVVKMVHLSLPVGKLCSSSLPNSPKRNRRKVRPAEVGVGEGGCEHSSHPVPHAGSPLLQSGREWPSTLVRLSPWSSLFQPPPDGLRHTPLYRQYSTHPKALSLKSASSLCPLS